MTTKRFVAKFGLDNNNQTITNVASPVNSSDVATKNTTDGILTFAQAAYNAANNVAPQIQPAFDKANSAYDNTIYLQSVNNHQNTRILQTENDTVYLTSVLTDVNSKISFANTWLQSNDAHTLSSAQSYTDSANAQLKSYSDSTFFAKTGGSISGAVEISSSLLVTGNLIVTGNVTSVSANNLSIQDNMIYLNSNNYVSNPDLGFAGNYFDGTYQHAGFFRDHSSGVWKVFDSYLPEPDASPYIDTSNSSFRIASFQANVGHFNQIVTTSNVLVQGSLVVSSNNSITVPVGNTVQRPSGSSGMIRYNSDTGSFEGYTVTGWGSIGGGSVNIGNTAPSSPKDGDTWWNTDYGRLLIYYTDVDGSQWVDASPNQAGLLSKPVRQTFTAVGGQVYFTITGGYTPGLVDVFLNGVKLVNGTDVDVTSGTFVLLSSGAIVGSTVEVIGLNSVSLTDVVGTSGGTMLGTLNVPVVNVSNTITSNLFSGSGAALSNIPNTALVNTTITINGTSIALGGSGTLSNVPNSALSNSSISINGTSVPLGQSITVPNGLTIQTVKTSNFTAYSGNSYPVNTTSGAITVTLPSSPIPGDQINIIDYAGTAQLNNIIIDRNGKYINGVVTNAFISTKRSSVTLIYVDETQGWVLLNDGFSTSIPQSYAISYLVVAGGGGGGSRFAGGGGGGGVLVSSATLSSTITYSVTVGAGGAGGATSGGSGTAGAGFGSQGNSSSFSSYTATGGGYGAAGDSNNGGSGGSGGGGAGRFASSGGSGTSGQGNAGGSCNGNSPYRGAGGGGAGSSGSNGSDGSGNGGSGYTWSVTGSTYAGGGGGGGSGDGGANPGAGGSGGGGTGGYYQGTAAVSGTTNTGGGGGGGAYTGGNQAGASGGSGVVILVIPTIYYTGVTTGSPTVTTSGSNTILRYNASGSYTA